MLPLTQLDDGWSEIPSRYPGETNSLLINGVRVDFRWIPPGEFLIGGRVKVVLTRGYWLESTPTTQEFWRAVMDENPSYFQGERNYFDGDLTLPVESVSWERFQEFVAKLNDSGFAPSGWRFSLPTEAQWERACRAGKIASRCGKLDEIAWFGRNSRVNGRWTTRPVGGKKPNDWGLYDMIGNVWEWTLDPFAFYPDWTTTDLVGEWRERERRLFPDSKIRCWARIPANRRCPVYRVQRGGGVRSGRDCLSAESRVPGRRRYGGYRFLGGRVVLIPR